MKEISTRIKYSLQTPDHPAHLSLPSPLAPLCITAWYWARCAAATAAPPHCAARDPLYENRPSGTTAVFRHPHSRALAQRCAHCPQGTKPPLYPSPPSPVSNCTRKLLERPRTYGGSAGSFYLRKALTRAEDVVLADVKVASSEYKRFAGSRVTKDLMHPMA